MCCLWSHDAFGCGACLCCGVLCVACVGVFVGVVCGVCGGWLVFWIKYLRVF